MKLLYNISIQLYVFTVNIAALFNPKAKQWVKGRKQLFTKLEKALNKEKDIVWFHCASLGEFEQGKPIIEGYKKKHPKHKILLTFFSPSGYEIRRNYEGADWVFYLPADTPNNAKQFITLVQPIKAVFIKYEFWFNYMKQLKEQQIPFYTVATIFRAEQAFFKYKWFAKQLENVSHFFVQNKSSKELLAGIGYTNVTVSGDTRFDSVLEKVSNPKELPLIAAFTKDKKTIVCGSTWPKDEAILIQFIRNNPQYNYIIAPHEMQHLKALKEQTKGLLFSEATVGNINTNNVLIIDSIGILSSIYRYGAVAYIGGGFGVGIHNILEAVTYGLPVVFGPNYSRFAEANDLIALNGAVSIKDYASLEKAIAGFKNFDSKIATEYINTKSGATQEILKSL